MQVIKSVFSKPMRKTYKEKHVKILSNQILSSICVMHLGPFIHSVKTFIERAEVTGSIGNHVFSVHLIYL